MKKLLLPFLCLCTLVSSAQDFRHLYEDAAEKKDLPAQELVLKNWEKASPRDPEMFIAYFNYYVRKSISDVISLDQQKKNNSAFALADTATGAQVGFLNFSSQYDTRTLRKGFEYIERGIALHPKRLDMRFGRVYMFGEAENYEAFTDALVETIHYGASINQQWLWKEGKAPDEDPKEFFLSTVQSYIHTIYNTEDDALLPLMRRISQAVLQHYPEHVESMSNVALTYLIIGEYEKALPMLLKAETVAPKDIIVLNNIGQSYKRMGDKTKAKAYFEKVIKYGSKEDIEDAKQNIKELNQ